MGTGATQQGMTKLHKTLFSNLPRRKLRSALRKWINVEKYENQQETEAATQKYIRDKVLNNLIIRRESNQRHKLAVTCWRWTANAASIHVNRLESKCVVYRDNQIRDAAISASYEKELINLRQKMVGNKQTRRKERSQDRTTQRRHAVVRLSNIRMAQERQHCHSRKTTMWVRWREKVGLSRQADLAHKLEVTRVQSRQAAGRITDLVERAQRERAQTVKLLKTMKQRTTDMEDRVGDHIVASPGTAGRRSVSP